MDRPNLGGNQLWKDQMAYLIASQNDYARTSKWHPSTAPLPDCGGIGTAFVDIHIAENEKDRDVTDLPYGYPLIVAVVKQAIYDYSDAIAKFYIGEGKSESLQEPYSFLLDFSDALGVDISWLEYAIQDEVEKKIKELRRKEKLNGRKRNHLW